MAKSSQYLSSRQVQYSCSRSKYWLSFVLILLATVSTIHAQCPWQREIPDLQTSCLCAYNLGHELSVQCDQVSFSIHFTKGINIK